MEKYSIKVNILNRPYPLLVRGDEEESVRNAAKLINEKVKAYKEKFSVKDDIDLVIMCCLELATDNINQSKKHSRTNEIAGEALTKIDSLLNSAILKSEEGVPLDKLRSDK